MPDGIEDQIQAAIRRTRDRVYNEVRRGAMTRSEYGTVLWVLRELRDDFRKNGKHATLWDKLPEHILDGPCWCGFTTETVSA